MPLRLGVPGLLCLALLQAAVSPSSVDAATIYSGPAAFAAATGAISIPLPDTATTFPGTSCGGGDTGPTGIGASFSVAFGSNQVVVSGATGQDLCIFDNGTIINSLNTNPNVMIANTIVGNGEDDFLLTFDTPVFAIGLRLLTNAQADELVTVRDSTGVVIEVVDIDAFTDPDSRPFVGLVSSTAFKSVILDTSNGAVENEGFDILLVGTTAVPEPSAIALLIAGLGTLGWLAANTIRLRKPPWFVSGGAVALVLLLGTPCMADGLSDGLSAFANADHRTAFRLLLPLASRGNSEAQYRIGRIYASGLGDVPKNLSEAHKWFRRAAEQGQSEAQFRVAVQYDLGEGVARDPAEALKWYRLAADQNQPEAHYYLGLSYAAGDIVPQSDSLAFQSLLRAAELGLPQAELRVARAFLFGNGVAKDQIQATVWYQRAAEHGIPEAQTQIGFYYEVGRGLPQDYVKAAKWYLAAAEQGHVLAQVSLARFYLDGRGVPQDVGEAVKWYKRAAIAGNAVAQVDLGAMYYRGDGVEENKSEAARWFRTAAEQGDGPGQHRLAIAYRYGWGVPQDFVIAYMWSNLAAAILTGELQKKATELRDGLSRLLSPAQLARAQELSRDWKPTPPATTKREDSAPQQTPSQRLSTPDASGSGFFVTRTGHVVTNFHVVERCNAIRVKAKGTTAQPAQLVAVDPKNDLALLKTNRTSFTSVFRGGRSARSGEAVMAIGYPLRGLLGSEASVTDGIVSALAGPQDDTRYLQFTAPIQAGSSGGPLLDEFGSVIGIVVAKLNAIEVARQTGDLPQNVNVAISAASLRAFLDANDISYETAIPANKLAKRDISDHGRRFTVAVECQQ